jgi:hypothetical protein
MDLDYDICLTAGERSLECTAIYHKGSKIYRK